MQPTHGLRNPPAQRHHRDVDPISLPKCRMIWHKYGNSFKTSPCYAEQSSIAVRSISMPTKEALTRLREAITENLRIQRSGPRSIPYIDVSHALDDARSRQNHVIFG